MNAILNHYYKLILKLFAWNRQKTQGYIGLSLSMCVVDIIEGYIPYKDVSCILSGTRIKSIGDLNIVFNEYKKTVWEEYDSDTIWEVLNYLIFNNKLIQERVLDDTNDVYRGSNWLYCDTFGAEIHTVTRANLEENYLTINPMERETA